MTRNLIYLSLVLLCLSSCVTSSYEKAIADWIQTDGDGTWTDMKFDLIEVIETKDITVLDSINILLDEKDKKIMWCNKKITQLKQTIDKFEKGMMIAPSTYFNARDKLKQTVALLDSIEQSNTPLIYEGRDKTELLAKLMKCKYAIIPPLLNSKQEKIETFLLDPKMNKCLGRMKKNI